MKKDTPSNTLSPKTYLASLQKITVPENLHALTGALPHKLTNDAMFHLVWEANPHALKEFLCSLLSYPASKIDSMEIKNPLLIGEAIDDKKFVLDTHIQLNKNAMVNIEMQVVNLSFWKERSLGYLCRSFDNLNKGTNYSNTKPAIHIGILDFEVFPDDTEFFASYHLANDKTHKIYTGKFELFVLQLKQAEHATPEDIASGIHIWAQLFKAATWEEVFTLAEQNPVIMDIAATMYRADVDEYTRHLLDAREMGERTYNTLTGMLDDATQQLDEQARQLDEQARQLLEHSKTITAKEEENARLIALLKQNGIDF